jgi:DNA-binding NarL/FixJ family response regulator
MTQPPLPRCVELSAKMTEPIRVILVDDHAILRQGTAELLRREPGLEVIGEAGDGQHAVELVELLRPDVVVMDVRMPGVSGVEATQRIHASWPAVQVLVLTAHDDDEYVFSLLEAGASGYLLKSAPVSDLVKAIRQVKAGESPLDPAVARKIVSRVGGAHERTPAGGESALVEELSARELEVLRFLAQGMSNRAIGEALFISDRTVQAHLTNIYAKMGVTTRLDAVLTAIRRGLLTLGP